MYNFEYDANAIDKAFNSAANIAMWTIIAFILAIIGGVLVYFLFVKSDKKVNDYLTKLKDILDFKTMLIEPILKILYLILTIFIILFSFNLIAVNFLGFLLCLIIGPIIVRIIYEAAMILIMIWKNTQEINEMLKKKEKKN